LCNKSEQKQRGDSREFSHGRTIGLPVLVRARIDSFMSVVRIVCMSAGLLVLHAQDLPQDNSAPPAIRAGGITNAASRMSSGLPSGAIAQGSLFVIQGWRLSAKDSVRIRIARGSESVEVPAVSAAEEEVEAVMPENAPLGDADLTVVRDGKASLSAPIRIAPASFGIFSRNKLGWGPGEILNAGGEPNTPAHAAIPGEPVTIFGSGLGARRSTRPVIFVGAARVAKIMRVRKSSFRPGADEIRFVLPPDAPSGCYVPIRVGVEGTVSNSVTMAVARRGDRCDAAENWAPSALFQPGATAVFAFVRANLFLRMRTNEPTEFPMDAAYASFLTRSEEVGANLLATSPPLGTCTTFGGKFNLSSFLSPSQTLGLDAAGIADAGRALDAGPGITVQGSADTKTLRQSNKQAGRYSAFLGGTLPVPIRRPGPLFLNPGTYQISVPGGADVAAFQVSAEIPQPIAWTAPSAADPIDRKDGVTVQWKAVHPSDRVFIVAMNMDRSTGATGLCVCAQNAARESFLIPPDALANIPASAAGTPSQQMFSIMLVAELSLQPLSPASPVPGLEHMWFAFASIAGHPVTYR
jgi:uncharacterized protein (TIGR03437 family)